MKCLLIYYTGTYNTRYLSGLLRDRLQKENIKTDLYEIDCLHTERLDFSGYDLIGLGYPIYGFNAPYAFLKFVKQQTFPAGIRTFIYKNSGETYPANDASSMSIVRKLKHDRAVINNEYHFMMPYNIHFRFEDALIKEMLDMDGLLLDILVREVTDGIANIRKYKLYQRIITLAVRIQYIGGNVNSFFYRVDNKKCIKCKKCVSNCPADNIYINKNGGIAFHHHCLMCMRCSFTCPKDAIRIGLLEGWHVNGPYDFEKISRIQNPSPVITEQTEGFFRCYAVTYKQIRIRHEELFGK